MSTTATETKPETTTKGKSTGDADAQPPDVISAKATTALATNTPAPLAQRTAPAYIPMVNGSLVPQDFEGMWRMAQLFYRGGLLPYGVDTPDKVCIALMAGMEVGLTPTQSIQNIMIVNGRPSMWGDAVIGLVRSKPFAGPISESVSLNDKLELDDASVATCTATRYINGVDGKPVAETITRTYSVKDAKLAGLWNKKGHNGKDTPWVTSPKRMLQMRARAFCLRDLFADVLKGIGVREEVDDYTAPSAPKTVETHEAPELESLPQAPAVDLTQVRTAPEPAASAPANGKKPRTK